MPDPKYTGISDEGLPRGRMRVVDKDELARVTEAGGHLIRVLATQRLTASLSQEGNLRCAKCGDRLSLVSGSFRCYPCNTIGDVPPATVASIDTHEYLVLIEVDQVYEGLRADARRANQYASERYKAAQDAEKLQKTAEDLLQQRNIELENLRKGADVHMKELHDLRQRAAKTETDLAKVRVAIGDHKWKEIIG